MTRAALVPALVVLGMSAMAYVGPAVAGPMPDHVQLALMRRAVEETPLVRMRGDFGMLQGYRPLLDSSGVRLAALGGKRNAMRTAVVNDSPIEPIPWDRISSLETDRAGRAASSTLIGGVIGLLVAGVIALSDVNLFSFRDQTHDHDGAMLASIGGGFALGYLIGQHGKRRTIYPPREAK